jgi:hypothetical protein
MKKRGTTKDKEEKFYPDDEQGILKDETSEEVEQSMKVGDKDEDIYTKEGQELLEEDDEIEPWEEGFMEGAAHLGQLGKDALTGEPLRDKEDVVETKYEGKIYRFNNKAHSVEFLAKKKKEAKNKK